MTASASLPIAVIGAGPVGLAAAAHLIQRGETPIVFETGSSIAASVRSWGHVQLFSPWRYVVDPAAGALLAETGWHAPDPETYPTGASLVERYLEPLAALPAIAPRLRLGRRVVAVAREGFDKLKTTGREGAPFVLHVVAADGSEEYVLAKAVIDASGTSTTPNPLGANGLPAIGERAAAERIFYGIPDVLGDARERYASKRVLVAGSGHSAFNALLDLAALAAEAPGTAVTWVVRRGDDKMGQAYGGGANDALPARGALGQRLRALVERGTIQLVTGWRTDRLTHTEQGIVAYAGERALPPVDEIIVATGLRPDLAMLGELRLGLDPVVEAPTALAPLIDPNVHSCGSVPPHGVDELAHPEPGFYIVGMKSYGRAPTFLLLTGYEQVRSVVAAIAGDWQAARDVQLVLPETGVCSGPVAAGGVASGCCGPASPVASSPTLIALAPAVATISDCCAAEAQATCCEPADKADCCGTPTSVAPSNAIGVIALQTSSGSGCGCQ